MTTKYVFIAHTHTLTHRDKEVGRIRKLSTYKGRKKERREKCWQDKITGRQKKKKDKR